MTKAAKQQAIQTDNAALIANAKQVMGDETLSLNEICNRLAAQGLLPIEPDPKAYVSVNLTSEKDHFERVGPNRYRVKQVEVEVDHDPFTATAEPQEALPSYEVGFRGAVAIDALKPNELNAKLFPVTLQAENLTALAESLRQHGQRNEIVIDGHGTIYDGERRWRAAQLASLPEVNIVVVETKTDDELRDYILDCYTSVRQSPLSERVGLFRLLKKKNPKTDAERKALAQRCGLGSWGFASNAAAVFSSKYVDLREQIESGEISVAKAYAAHKAAKDAAENTTPAKPVENNTTPAETKNSFVQNNTEQPSAPVETNVANDAADENNTDDTDPNVASDGETNVANDDDDPIGKALEAQALAIAAKTHIAPLQGRYVTEAIRIVSRPLGGMASELLDLLLHCMLDMQAGREPTECLDTLQRKVDERKCHYASIAAKQLAEAEPVEELVEQPDEEEDEAQEEADEDQDVETDPFAEDEEEPQSEDDEMAEGDVLLDDDGEPVGSGKSTDDEIDELLNGDY